MKKVGINYRSKLGTPLVEGERIELKIDRMTQNNRTICGEIQLNDLVIDLKMSN